MRRITTLMAALAMLAVTSMGALAAPMLNGTIGFTGAFEAENSSGNNVRFPLATQIDFSPQGGGNGIFSVNAFSTSGNFTIFNGQIGSIQDFVFAPFSGPIANFYTVNGLSFDLSSVAIDTQNNNTLAITGSGTLKLAGFDPTPGSFNFSGQTDGVNRVGVFTFSAGSAAMPVPEPASLALFGTALLGLGMLRRARRKV